MTEFNAPGKVPPALTGTASYVPPPEQWDPEGDIHLAGGLNGVELFAPTIVRAPPQLPRPEQHPHRHDFPPRGVSIFITDASRDMSPGRALAFTASSIQVDNFSNQWLFFPSAQRWIPPCYFGIILPVVPGTQVAEYRVQIPSGHAAGAIGAATSPVVTVWFEEAMYPTAGVLLTV
jgi:hypothetical protein